MQHWDVSDANMSKKWDVSDAPVALLVVVTI